MRLNFKTFILGLAMGATAALGTAAAETWKLAVT